MQTWWFEVEATQVSGSLNSSYGLLFRLNPEIGFYRFEVTSDGSYLIEKRMGSDGSWERLSAGWVSSPTILIGLGQVNRLKVMANGSRLTFFINGIEVAEVEDGDFAVGKLALSAGTFNQAGLEVAFDNLTISNP